ncbi:beta-glucosidase BglX [Edaphobacter bradus]|uniref:beta-glucosidase BglX n=1 Tax=Edaphobacter bradus TaxID=2259016 RepID=UPI0021DFF67B|nr:beta-glucosidase BglX [Edaphobacter bradus]
MTSRRRPGSLLRNLTFVIACLSPFVQAQSHETSAPSEAAVQQRANTLLHHMTTDEKIGQLTQLFYQYFPDTVSFEERIRKGQVGSFLFITDPVAINHLQHVAVEESRMHIPLLIGFDVIHGFRTTFPVPLALASSWDPSLIEHVQTVAAHEASAAGVRWAFTPMVDIARDPRWGRIVEGAGEDPYLDAAVTRAQVRGLQGPYLGSPEHVLACVKHFAAYGAADGGRDYDSSYVSEDLLRNVYFPPFHAAIDAGVGSVMSAYMDLNDVPASGNTFLLQQVLRKEWGFSGFVVSDAFAVQDLTTHGFASDPQEATYRAFSAGVNMDMGSKTYLANLGNLIEDKKLSTAQLDNMVRPVLEAKIRLGLFEHPYVDVAQTEAVLKAPESRALARLAAQRTAVLLRNESHTLPLSKSLSSLALIGPLANVQKPLQGPWSFAGEPKDVVTILQGLRNKLPASTRIEYAQGTDLKREYQNDDNTGSDAEIEKAVQTAMHADATVLVLGELDDMSGEAASRSSLDLAGRQQRLLEAVAATGKPLVLVLVNGRPLNISWAAAHVSTILDVWYPGIEGGNAVADLLFGDANPGGKLTFSWPRSEDQIPIYYAHNLTHVPETSKDFVSRYWDGPSSPLYPFGYGLNYTSFAISNLKLSHRQVGAGERVEASVDVENTGSKAGDEVVQLYIHQRSGSASRPVRQLKGFRRITLAPGGKTTLSFALGKDELSYWSPSTQAWVEEPAEFDVWVGEDSTASLHDTFTVHP